MIQNQNVYKVQIKLYVLLKTPVVGTLKNW